MRYSFFVPLASQIWTQDSPNIHSFSEAFDEFGGALGAGDYNGDGVADLTIAAPGDNLGSTDNAGSLNVIYGDPR